MSSMTVVEPATNGTMAVPPSESTALMQIIGRAVADPQLDVAKLQALLDVKRQYEADEARKAFVVALAAFKRNPPRITKNKHVGFTSKREGTSPTDYWHATLDHLCDITSGPLSAQGLSVRWETQQLDKSLIKVTCILQHVAGHSERVTLEAGADQSGNKNSIQAVGSTVTYLQRYTMLSALGLATGGTDDDGRGGKEDGGEEGPDPWTDEVKATALAEANKGLTVFKKWWQAQSMDFRAAARLTATYADFLAKAQENK